LYCSLGRRLYGCDLTAVLCKSAGMVGQARSGTRRSGQKDENNGSRSHLGRHLEDGDKEFTDWPTVMPVPKGAELAHRQRGQRKRQNGSIQLYPGSPTTLMSDPTWVSPERRTVSQFGFVDTIESELPDALARPIFPCSWILTTPVSGNLDKLPLYHTTLTPYFSVFKMHVIVSR
jgi:hypothetical protein